MGSGQESLPAATPRGKETPRGALAPVRTLLRQEKVKIKL